MYFELARKNIKSNVRDYMLYFITIIVIVSVFFAFSSTDIISYILGVIGIQKESAIESMRESLIMISVVIMLGLTVIIIYANSFFIKRRKKDIGVCLSLGMSKSNIAKVLFLESIFIAIVAIIIGVIGGIILSQIILMISLHIIGGNLAEYKFIFSIKALIETVIYFMSVFIVVGIINMSLASRKISKVLKDKKKKSLLVQDSIISSAVILIVGILGIVSGWLILLSYTDTKIILATILLVGVSIILCMIGIVNIIIYLSFKNTKVFLKGINIFSVCQLKTNASRIVITSVISSLLLVVSMLSIALTVDVQGSYAMNSMNPKIDAIVTPIIAINKLSQFDYIMDKSSASKNYDYAASMRLFFTGELNIKGSSSEKVYRQFNVATLTWYNQYMKMIGKPDAKLSPNQAIIIANSNDELKLFKSIGDNQSFEFGGNKYSVKDVELVQNYQGNYYMPQNTPTLILPVSVEVQHYKEPTTKVDQAIITQDGKKLKFTKSQYNGYAPTLALNAKTPEYNTVLAYQNLENSFTNLIKNKDAQKALWGKTQNIDSKTFIVDSRVGDNASLKQSIVIATFTGLYLGIIFLVGSVTLIGLQVLIETSEEKERYNTLKNIGANDKEINSNLLKQIIIRFAIPFVFVIINFIFICVIWGFKGMLGDDYKVLPIAILLTLIFYILYSAITYTMAKKIIKK
ncbi:MAG: FtsX-like permease family protein [Sarcina sp.]